MRTESTKSNSLSESGRRFINSIKSSLKLSSSSAYAKSQSNRNAVQNNNASPEGSNEADIRQRPMNAVHIKEMSDKFKLMPVAVEPLVNNKSGIITCILKLPQGELKTTPKGSSPFVLCTAYVQISSNSSLVNYNNFEADKIGTTLSSVNSPNKLNEV